MQTKVKGPIGREVCKVLRQIRLDMDVSQSEVAEIIGWQSQQMVSYLERGKIKLPSDHALRLRVAKAYRLDPADFCRWCMLAELEDKHVAPDLLYQLAHEPLLDAAGAGSGAGCAAAAGDPGGDHREPAVALSGGRSNSGPGGDVTLCLVADLLSAIERSLRRSKGGETLVAMCVAIHEALRLIMYTKESEHVHDDSWQALQAC